MNILICYNGRIGSVDAVCERLGLRSRFQLNRLLHREGLPPYEELAGWVCVLYWMVLADAGEERGALLGFARRARMRITSAYRLVRRVTGRSWKDVRRAGTAEVTRWFRRRTHHAAIEGLKRRAPARSPVPSPRLPEPLTSRSMAEPRRIPLAGAPFGVAVHDPALAYVTRSHAAAIERVNLRTGQCVGSIPVGCTPSCVVFDPSGAQAYVTVQYCDEIAVIDTARHAQVRTLPVLGNPFAIVFSRASHALFVTTNADRLLALSARTGRVVGSIELPATSHHLALHPAGDRMYVATRAGGSVLEVDTQRLRVLRTFALGGWPQGVVVSPDGTTLYVANEREGLDVVRLGNGARIDKIEGEKGAVSLALSPDHRFLYAGHTREGKVGMIDVSSLTPRGTLYTGGRPGQIGFDGTGGAIIANEGGWLDMVPLGETRVASTH